jgi:transmembrane sensor
MIFKPEDKDKIERYIAGQGIESEIEWAENLFLKGEENETLRHSLKKEWSAGVHDESFVNTNLSHILDRVHHRIRKDEDLKRQKPLHKILRIYMKVAAILLLPLLITFLGYKYLLNSPAGDKNVSSSIYAPMGARVSFNLPDGTTGMLNSGSRLSYSIPFSGNRRVTLDGEAWFNVYHDEKHPFEIISGTSTVKVFGTRFNMSAYPEESYVEVVLEEGKVSYKNKDVPNEVLIFPLERLIFKDGNISYRSGKVQCVDRGKACFQRRSNGRSSQTYGTVV